MPISNKSVKASGFKPEWITKKIDAECIQFMEDFGYLISDFNEKWNGAGRNAVTTSQIRNIFGEVKRIQVKIDAGYNWEQDFLMLRPKIAYNAARVLSERRNSRSKISDLKELLEKAHACVNNDPEAFKRFSSILEGILAYHKVYGGKDNSN